MSEDQDLEKPNFRSSYYVSLGVRAGEQSLISHLEGLIKAEAVDLEKLKLFCLKHTIPVYYRSRVWKLLLGVVPVYNDEETCLFVRSQREQQFQDLKHTLQVMGRLGHSSSLSPPMGRLGHSSSLSPPMGRLGHSSSLSPPMGRLGHSSSLSPPMGRLGHSSSLSPPMGRLGHSSSLSPPMGRLGHSSSLSPPMGRLGHSSSLSPPMGRLGHSSSLSPPGLTLHSSCPQDFVVIYLLENDRLLSPAVNQLKLEHQIDLCAIAQAFLTLFDGEEDEVETYWLFSKFARKWESQQQHVSFLCFQCLQCLEEVDAELYYHLKLLNVLHGGLPFVRWFNHCFAAELPEPCLESIWDKVIAGSCMILVYVAVAVLLSVRRKILGLQTREEISHLLNKIPKDNYSLTASKAIELWESHGSMLAPDLTLSRRDSVNSSTK